MQHLISRTGLDLFILALTIGGLVLTLASGGYIQFVMGLVALTTVLCVGLNVLYGLTGLVSLGQVGFFAIGAYATGVLLLNDVSFWIALPAAAVAAGISGWLLAIPAVRMAGPFLAMVTIAFAFIVEHGAVEWRSVTGGQNGLMGFQMPMIGGYTLSETDLVLFSICLAGLSLYLYRRLADSGWGMAMTGMRDAETAASSLGYKPFVVKSTAFAIAAAMAGVAGGLFTPLMMFIAPSNFPFSQSILFLFAVLIGGAGSVLGPLAGALVTVLLPEFLSGLAEYRLLFFGGLLVGVLLIAPRGLVGSIAAFLPRPSRAIDPRPATEIEALLAEYSKPDKLEIQGLGISFGGVRAVDDVSLSLPSGAVTSIIGPNGAGKTTILNMISGFYKPTDGDITLSGKSLAGLPAFEAARSGIARTYQTTKLFENMSVVANVISGLSRGRLGQPLARIESPENLELAAGLLRYCGYLGDLDKRAGDLPHVDRRLVEIARALAMKPGVLLLDEPAAGLMRADKDQLAVILRKIADLGLAVVLVEHDMELVMGISDRIQAVDAGKPIAFGTPSEIQENEIVIAAYLGDGSAPALPRKDLLETVETPVLSTLKLTAGYGAAPVLKDVTLKVRPGEMVALLGANGAGKSTFLSAVSGLHRPVDGSIILKDEPVHALAPHDLVARGLVLVPEGRQVFPELTVLENIELGAYKRQRDMSGDEVEALLERFPRLKDRLHSRAGLLSGGEQQMMAIARGLMARPSVLLLDEPSLGLAPAMINELYAILGELRDEGTTILLVDQMASLALSVADYGYVLEQGRIVMEGPANELISDERLTAAYLGGGEDVSMQEAAR
ncbi:ATP-binding cassette domain-containing protein [Roseibium polysiphoniae]|uniref:ATP-binding cassette domain-containing protein n=1 Tax=Roseibium polysiphoniae TaxID=2571221 RepID=A0ABR9C8B8_9HYPH|nr:ATP-binding cassette domain-containing protein [Roseibium polysiphoniae]MBD8875818.1 ATP-binding cassette domain-containing protein [Roseibium polysiphoniae]